MTVTGLMQFPIELIHIDDKFTAKYGNIDIPYLTIRLRFLLAFTEQTFLHQSSRA